MSLRGTKRCRETADDQENPMRSIHPPPLISDSVKGLYNFHILPKPTPTKLQGSKKQIIKLQNLNFTINSR